jgi:hypothetical protein
MLLLQRGSQTRSRTVAHCFKSPNVGWFNFGSCHPSEVVVDLRCVFIGVAWLLRDAIIIMECPSCKYIYHVGLLGGSLLSVPGSHWLLVCPYYGR